MSNQRNAGVGKEPSKVTERKRQTCGSLGWGSGHFFTKGQKINILVFEGQQAKLTILYMYLHIKREKNMQLFLLNSLYNTRI